MKYRTLGKTGVKISEVGLGTWQLGGVDWGNMSDDDALKILRRAVDLGVNFFDTADVYGLGRSETLIGKFLKETKGKVYVATKLSRRRWVEMKGWPAKYTLDMVREDIRFSLKNLGVDSLFLQQWHCPPTEWYRAGDIFELMEKAKKEGLIRHWGCSVESVEEGLLAIKHPGCASLQVIYNIFRQKLTTELLPQAKAANVGILARVPLASGLLTGRFQKGHKFSDGDHRSYNADGKAFNVGETFAGVPFEKGVEFAGAIGAILKPTEKAPMAQLALRWVLDQDGVTTVIPGATKISQVESNTAASDLPPIAAPAQGALRELYDTKIRPAIRGTY
ncbi:MAG: aldo/keto reductase [Planctomycetes bacterium]|nr:aldo/keto reductase [Planctomycetota bacterium]